MAVGDQDHGCVAVAVPTVLAGAVHEPFDLALGEIAPFNCVLLLHSQSFHNLMGGVVRTRSTRRAKLRAQAAIRMVFDGRAMRPPGRRDFSISIPGGSPEATRRAFNKRFLLDLAEDWQQHGREVFKRVRRESPASYLKVCAMLVPKELKMEHSGGVKAMTDEQIERSIELIRR